MLVIGSDTRSHQGGGQFGGTTDVQGQRSDSIILVRVDSEDPFSGPAVDPARHPGADSRLRHDPHQHRLQQRRPLSAGAVLDQDFGIQINHVAVFNFDTFEAVADAVGGVEQYFPDSRARSSFPT